LSFPAIALRGEIFLLGAFILRLNIGQGQKQGAAKREDDCFHYVYV
jgi:hypothetical protein